MQKVHLIRLFLSIGLPTGKIVDLLPCMVPKPSSASALRSAEVMQEELDHIRGRIGDLEAAAGALEELITFAGQYANDRAALQTDATPAQDPNRRLRPEWSRR